jgi:autotransporter-associated beta strand protein
VSGAITDGGAGGSLVKIGTGTLTLSGTATYTGATTVSDGTLAGGAANAFSAASAFTVDATLDLGGFSQTIASLSGSGTVTNSGTNDATLTAGDNTSTIFSGAIEDGQDATTALTKVGAGTLILSGTNTYTAGTSLLGGAVQVARDANLGDASGALTFNGGALKLGGSFDLAATRQITLNAGGGTFDTNGFSTTVSRAISGVGGLTKVGTGTLTLAGANTYTGGTTILDGTLEIGGTASSIVGDVLNDATLAFNRSNTYQFDGSISGTGDVRQNGTGTTILTGTSTYTGATMVSSGKLLVNGSIASSSGVTVDAGATIGGSGTLSDTVVNGTLSAGNSPGTLTVDGDLTLGATSVSLFELGAPGVVGGASNDLVNVSGNLVLGGTLQTPVAVSGYYRLFNVDGTMSGSYASVPTDASVQTAIAHQVNLLITNGGQFVQFWDGADGTGNGSVDGGDGTWSAAGTNWTGAPGSANFNDQWHREVGVFAGTAGTVTVSGPVAFEGLQFKTTGYTIAGGDLTLSGDSAGSAAAIV